MASSAPKKRLQALSEQLIHRPRSEPNHFESLPSIPTVASPSTGLRVKDKVCIITGANSPLGIGRATAHHFAQNGARAIFLCDLATTHLDTHKREIESKYGAGGTKVHWMKVDAGKEEDVERVVDEAIKVYGRLDVFFANAGISVTMGSVLEGGAQDFMDVMRVNALSVFLAVKHGARGMLVTGEEKKFPGGSIVGTGKCARFDFAVHVLCS